MKRRRWMAAMSQSGPNVTILVAEDDALLRNFLLVKLKDQSDFTVLGSAGDGREALDATASLKPDVLLLDLSLPGLTGMQVLERLSDLERSPAVLVLSGDEADETQLDAARYG